MESKHVGYLTARGQFYGSLTAMPAHERGTAVALVRAADATTADAKKHSTGPLASLTDPMLAPAIKVIEDAIKDHCRGSDLWLCAAVAAQKIIGEIAHESVHRFAGCEPGPWKRMPPALRDAIARATGSAK
jgi:hypothetical protein